MADFKTHNYVFGEGGTGIRLLLAAYHWLNTKAMAKESNNENWKLVFETMDAGAEEIEELLRLQDLQKEIGSFGDAAPSEFTFAELAKRVAALAKNAQSAEDSLKEGIGLAEVLPEWYANELLLSEEELHLDVFGGFYRDKTLGSMVLPATIACALETPEDKRSGFRAVVDDVVASNGSYEVRVLLAGNGWGGEGVTNLCSHPEILKELCIVRVMDALKTDREKATAYVEKTLHIAVIMVGSAFRFPTTQRLDQNIAGLLAGTLQSYPDASAEAVNLFYLLEHDDCPVQATKGEDRGRQAKKAHAIELVGVAMMEDFFHRDTEAVSKKQCPVIPHYSMPGNTYTNWENLGLLDQYREKLSARLRFDAAMFYWVLPQLLLSSEEKSAGKLYQSEILHQMYHQRSDKKLEEAILTGEKGDLEETVLKPLRALWNREKMFLNFLLELSQTGRNWEKEDRNVASGCGTSLFPVTEIANMLGEISEDALQKVGGMTGFRFDDLTKCPPNPVTGKSEDNFYTTNLTLDKLRKRVFKTRKIDSLEDLLEVVYTVSCDRKERKLWL